MIFHVNHLLSHEVSRLIYFVKRKKSKCSAAVVIDGCKGLLHLQEVAEGVRGHISIFSASALSFAFFPHPPHFFLFPLINYLCCPIFLSPVVQN